jgi:hypothetical protein
MPSPGPYVPPRDRKLAKRFRELSQKRLLEFYEEIKRIEVRRLALMNLITQKNPTPRAMSEDARHLIEEARKISTLMDKILEERSMRVGITYVSKLGRNRYIEL